MSSTTTNDAPSFNVKASDWDRASESYAQLDSKGSPMSVPITKLVEMLHTFLPFDSATTILDIGCGPGNATAQLISTHHTAIPASTQLLATDFSSGMLNLASEVRTANLSVMQGTEKDTWARVVPLVLDAADLRPLLSGSVSHIIANFVLFIIDNPAKALREAHRVLKNDGVAACSSWSNKMDWIEYFGLAASRTFPAIGKPLPQRPTFAAQWTSVEGVGALFTDAGFRDIHTEYVEAPIVVHSVEGVAHHFLTSGNPAVTWATDVLNETEVEQLEKQLVQVIKEKSKVENGAYILGGTAVLAIGRK
ncbi:S-adenosyl-L-methionine-dependent methyltransferase [Aureobasidium sp. EXF-12344]|nr:S-adenosyl-L-methionine-dependent methyltransferase [Aureobasidium sp. EXF-12344]